MDEIRLIDMKSIQVNKKTNEWGIEIHIQCEECKNIKKYLFIDELLVDKFFKDYENNNLSGEYFCKKCDFKKNKNLN